MKTTGTRLCDRIEVWRCMQYFYAICRRITFPGGKCGDLGAWNLHMVCVEGGAWMAQVDKCVLTLCPLTAVWACMLP